MKLIFWKLINYLVFYRQNIVFSWSTALLCFFRFDKLQSFNDNVHGQSKKNWLINIVRKPVAAVLIHRPNKQKHFFRKTRDIVPLSRAFKGTQEWEFLAPIFNFVLFQCYLWLNIKAL